MSNRFCIIFFIKLSSLITHKLFGFRLDSFFIFYRFNPCIFQASIMHKKYLTFLFFEDNDSIAAKFTAQILSLNLAETFLLLNVLVTDLCNSSASRSFTLIPDPVFLSRTYRPYLLMLFDTNNSYNFYQFRELYLSKFYMKYLQS